MPSPKSSQNVARLEGIALQRRNLSVLRLLVLKVVLTLALTLALFPGQKEEPLQFPVSWMRVRQTQAHNIL